MISQKTLQMIAMVLGGILFVSLILLVVFGVQLANSSSAKAKEIQSDLTVQEKKLKADFQAEKEVNTITYTASDVFGSFQFTYPKVWSTNVAQDTTASEQLVFLADPNLIVQSRQDKGPFTALRVQVYGRSYDSEVKDVRNKLIVGARVPFKEADIVLSGLKGKKYSGKDDESSKNITFILLPLRDKTLYIGTDDVDKFSKNFDTISKTFKVSK